MSGRGVKKGKKTIITKSGYVAPTTAIKEAVAALGVVPSCIGHYQNGDPQCDGVPCAWRIGCRGYKHLCQIRNVDPQQERFLFPSGPFHYLLVSLMRGRGGFRDSANNYAWEHFIDVYCKEAQRRLGLFIHPERLEAERHELYLTAKYSEDESRLNYGRVKIAADVIAKKVTDPIFVRYSPNFKRNTISPTIEFWGSIPHIVEHYPLILDAAAAWEVVSPAGDGLANPGVLGVCAVGVSPYRIGDVARLAIRLLEDHIVPGIKIERGKIDFDIDLVKKWRQSSSIFRGFRDVTREITKTRRSLRRQARAEIAKVRLTSSRQEFYARAIVGRLAHIQAQLEAGEIEE